MLFNRPIHTRWLIGLLIALNLITLAALFFSRGHRPDRNRRPDTVGLFRHELNLNDEQAAHFETLRKTYFEQSKPLFKELRNTQQGVIEAWGKTPPDSLAIQRLRGEKNRLTDQIDSLLAHHYLDLRAACNPEQQAKLESVFLRAMWPGKGDRQERKERKERQERKERRD